MTSEVLTKQYFYPGTQGYTILRNYYAKYRGLFVKTLHHEFDEFLNQVLVNVLSIKFTNEIKNAEAYIIGTIKIQCRVQLDKALKIKSQSSPIFPINREDDGEETFFEKLPSDNQRPDEILETQEIFTAVNIFKLTLSSHETQLVNDLIDGLSRQELIDKAGSNINTLDTQIRRLRIKLITYLKNRGYSFSVFNKLKTN